MNRPLRVAFDARDLAARAQRGMVRYLVGLAKHLPAHGIRVTLFHRAREALNPAHLEGLSCEVVGLRDCSGVFWEQVSVPLALARGGFDLYHAPGERGLPLLAPCPVAFTIHSLTDKSYADLVRRRLLPGSASDYLGYDPDRGRWRWPRLYHRLQFELASHVFTVSEFSRRELIQLGRISPGRVSVTPLALPNEFTRPRDRANMPDVLARHGITSPYLLYVGGYEPHKNVRGLLAAFALVRRSRHDLSLVLTGTGHVPESIINAAKQHGLAPGRDVVFLADLTRELVDLYDGAAAFISLSWRESFGVPYLEAMARGVPVVASSWGASPEVLGKAGKLVDPRDPAAAAEAILGVLSRARRDEMTIHGEEQVKRFSWERTAELTAAAYRHLVQWGNA